MRNGFSRERNGAHSTGLRLLRQAAKQFHPGDRVTLDGRPAIMVVESIRPDGTVRLRHRQGPRLPNPVFADRLMRM